MNLVEHTGDIGPFTLADPVLALGRRLTDLYFVRDLYLVVDICLSEGGVSDLFADGSLLEEIGAKVEKTLVETEKSVIDCLTLFPVHFSSFFFSYPDQLEIVFVSSSLLGTSCLVRIRSIGVTGLVEKCFPSKVVQSRESPRPPRVLHSYYYTIVFVFPCVCKNPGSEFRQLRSTKPAADPNPV